MAKTQIRLIYFSIDQCIFLCENINMKFSYRLYMCSFLYKIVYDQFNRGAYDEQFTKLKRT